MNLQEIENRINELGKNIEKCQLESIELNKQWWNLKQMQPKEKTYQWEECFDGKKGFWYYNNEILELKENTTLSTDEEDAHEMKDIATTEKVIKSHLAACQLSHIIEAINSDFTETEGQYSICCESEDNEVHFYSMLTEHWALPYLNSEWACDKLIETNTPLLKQYFGVEDLE